MTVEKSKLNFVQQIVILVALLAASVALFYYFAWTPQANTLASLRDQRQQEEEKMESAKATLVRLEAVKKAAPKIEARIQKVNRKMPKQPELPNFLILLQNLANDSGVTMSSVKPGEPKESSGFGQMDVTLQVTGTYLQINDFLYRLENAERAIKVSTVSINNNGQNYPELNVSISLSTFILSDTPATPSVPPVSKPGVTKT